MDLLFLAWRVLWVIPVTAARMLLCAVVLVGWGPRLANEMWRDTE